MANGAKISATVITGFLGAGKTTLVRHLLENAGGRRIALIINEFGDVGIDGGLLRGCGEELCRDEDIVELANGCICCTVAEDFIPTMERLLDRPDAPDHIVIETSGLALPQPLVRAFQWPQIATRVTVDGVVTVVDGKAALTRLANSNSGVAAMAAALLTKPERVRFLGRLLFRVEGSLLTNRVGGDLSDRLHAQQTFETLGVDPRHAAQALDLMQEDLPLLNRIRSAVMKETSHG